MVWIRPRYGPLAHLQALLRQILPDLRTERFALLVDFRQMAKLAHRSLIGYGLAAQINPHKLPQLGGTEERWE